MAPPADVGEVPPGSLAAADGDRSYATMRAQRPYRPKPPWCRLGGTVEQGSLGVDFGHRERHLAPEPSFVDTGELGPVGIMEAHPLFSEPILGEPAGHALVIT
jgi:hypothetical protein